MFTSDFKVRCERSHLPGGPSPFLRTQRPKDGRARARAPHGPGAYFSVDSQESFGPDGIALRGALEAGGP